MAHNKEKIIGKNQQVLDNILKIWAKYN